MIVYLFFVNNKRYGVGSYTKMVISFSEQVDTYISSIFTTSIGFTNSSGQDKECFRYLHLSLIMKGILFTFMYRLCDLVVFILLGKLCANVYINFVFNVNCTIYIWEWFVYNVFFLCCIILFKYMHLSHALFRNY